MARTKFEQAEDAAKQVTQLVRSRALAAIFQHDKELSSVYETVAAGIRADLRATGFTIEQVRGIVEKHFASTSAARRAIIENAIIDAAREARVMPQATFDAIFGKEAAEGVPPLADRSLPPTTKR